MTIPGNNVRLTANGTPLPIVHSDFTFNRQDAILGVDNWLNLDAQIAVQASRRLTQWVDFNMSLTNLGWKQEELLTTDEFRLLHRGTELEVLRIHMWDKPFDAVVHGATAYVIDYGMVIYILNIPELAEDLHVAEVSTDTDQKVRVRLKHEPRVRQERKHGDKLRLWRRGDLRVVETDYWVKDKSMITDDQEVWHAKKVWRLPLDGDFRMFDSWVEGHNTGNEPVLADQLQEMGCTADADHVPEFLQVLREPPMFIEKDDEEFDTTYGLEETYNEDDE